MNRGKMVLLNKIKSKIDCFVVYKYFHTYHMFVSGFETKNEYFVFTTIFQRLEYFYKAFVSWYCFVSPVEK